MALFIEDWKDRLGSKIRFTSPSGLEFACHWRDSDHSIEKKLGIFTYPRVRGNVVQDLEANSDSYSIPFSFAGPDHDKDANQFIKACRERGQWQVFHPFEGFLGLQLIRITKLDRVVSDGNRTRFDSEWIEPIDETSLKTQAELAGLTLTDLDTLNIGAALQFANNIVDNTISQITAVQSAVNKVKVISATTLGPIAQLNATIANATTSIARGIDDSLANAVLEPLELAGQVQNLIQLPLRATTDINERLNAYKKMTDAVFELAPTGTSSSDKNVISVQELTLMSAVGANATIGVTGEQTPGIPSIGGLNSRAQAVETAKKIQAEFVKITENLDLMQVQYEDTDIDKQYFSQTQTYNDARKITATSTQYLLQAGFNLNIERRFYLDRPKTPLQITIEQYGSLGENDINLDVFIKSNDLRKDELLLLPPGKEIIVYA